MRPRRSRWSTVVAPIVTAAVLIAIWQLAVTGLHVPIFILPAPTDVVAAGIRTAPLLGPHIATTLIEAGVGLLIGVLAGLVLAVIIAGAPRAGDAIYPLVTLTQTIPAIVLAPLLILWAGFGLTPKIILVALTVFFPVLVSAVTAMRTVEADLTDMIQGLGGNRAQDFWLVRLPSALPGALAGLRVATTYTIGAAVVAEYIAGQSGLGVFIQRSRKAYAVDQIFVAIIIVAVLTAILFVVVDGLSRAATPWQREQR